MATATATQCEILERVTAPDKLTVDRENGVISNVKILGLESCNPASVLGVRGPAAREPYTYEPAALRSAVSLYEGLAVNLNHPPRTDPTADRVVADRFGKLEGVECKSDGLYAQRLRFLKTHPHAEPILEACESMPDLFALSHNAGGAYEIRDGRAVITEISNPRSVDVVTDGGTTNSIFESRRNQTMSQTVRQILEANKTHPIAAVLLEQDALPMPDVPVEAAPEESPDAQVKAAFRAMVIAAFDDETLDTAATIAKIREILKAQERLSDNPAEEPAEEIAVDDSDEPSAMESRLTKLEQENATLKNERAVASLIEAAGVTVDDDQRAALLEMTVAGRKAFIAALQNAPARPTRSPGVLQESDQRVPDMPTGDTKKFAAALR